MLANLSSPNKIGATENTVRSSRNAWYAGSERAVGRAIPDVDALVMGTS
jgi:hypothetical protein